MNALKLKWNLEAGQLTARWIESEEREEYEAFSIDREPPAVAQTMPTLADRFYLLDSANFATSSIQGN
jgi:hypothetical protein